MKINSRAFHTSHLTTNEKALVQCEAALALKDKGDYEGARKIMAPLWSCVGEQPNLNGIHPSVAAEVLLTAGILTRWIGSRNRTEGSQELAKNLITDSINYFESIGDVKKVAAARVEIACCYWREGALDEARITLKQALEVLTAGGNTRARAILRLAIVEWSDSRVVEAHEILINNASLFSKITNAATKGAFHSQLANVLTNLATLKNEKRHFLDAVNEYRKADDQFKLARNVVFRADVKNNIGFLLFQLSRFKEAHKFLEQARRLRSSVKDKVGIAQIDDTRAQVFIAEKKFKQAETVARNAVRILEKSGHQCLLADSLITQGIALARSNHSEPAQFIFQKAIEVAHQVGALNKAGLAAVTMMEELDDLPTDTLYAAYDRASEWLAKSQSQDILWRLNAVSKTILVKLRTQVGTEVVVIEDPIEALFNKPCDLQGEVLKFEGRVIQRALAKANGSLTRAAASLSMSYQALAYILESRQKDLLKDRTPIRRRARKGSAASPQETEQA